MDACSDSKVLCLQQPPGLRVWIKLSAPTSDDVGGPADVLREALHHDVDPPAGGRDDQRRKSVVHDEREVLRRAAKQLAACCSL